ncbi:WG repeat-containing protein [Hymenobacter monticola]|uniref:WG repeat-containing protein n=1 Tax=Hymenobacter monticola TaxID=1705399 RepID=A0ABY4B464_9BACT|nr:WG repeat-containing protein [Hymenobacter monticola]UOE33936.1 WG repeat-containing protein [Hymenobacter monticola]
MPFRHQNRYGLMTPAGKVLTPATFRLVPRALGRGHLWIGDAPPGDPQRLVLLAESGEVLGKFQSVDNVPGNWGWVQAVGAGRTITLFDSLGHVLRATRYGKLEAPHEGLMVVALPDSIFPGNSGAYQEGRRSLIDAQGREIAPPRYDHLENFRYGYAYAFIRATKTAPARSGVLDHAGREHWLGPEWDKSPLTYRGGFYTRQSEDRRQAMALSVDAKELVPFSAGLAAITREGADWTDFVKVQQRDVSVPNHPRETWGLYDSLLRPLLPPRYSRIDVSNGWSVLYGFDPAWPARTPGYDDPRKGAAWRGQLVLPAEFNSLEVSSDSRFVVAGTYAPATRSWRFTTSERGGPPLPFDVESARYVGHGVFAVQQHNRWGLMRANGQVLRPCQDENPTTQLQAGLYYSRGTEPGGPEIADTLGRTVLPAGANQAAGFFTPTLAWVKRDGHYGVFSLRTGKFLLPPVLDDLPKMQPDGTFWAEHEGKTFIGSDGGPLVTFDAPGFRPAVLVGPELVLGTCGRGTDWALYNRKGRLISTEIVYVEGTVRNGLTAFARSNGVLWAKNAAGRYALINAQGQLLTPFKYDLFLDLQENAYPFYRGLGLAYNQDRQFVYVDCLGREYAW